MTVASPLRVAFAGTPQFAVPALQALLDSPHTVIGVLTQPDRPQGRGRQLLPGPVKQVALQHGLLVAQPPTLRDPAARNELAALAPDVMVVVAFGQILPREVLQLPRLGCLNIHASLLPRWRGAAPIQRAILAGDTETGVTIMQMDEGLDTGGMLAVRAVPIGERATSASLHDELSVLGARALLEVLESLATGARAAQPQAAAGASYAHKLAKSEAHINWAAPAAAISRQVRAFNPWPVAQTVFSGEPLRIHDAYAPAAAAPAAGAPGTWLGLAAGPGGEVLRVACGAGELHVARLQRAGRKVVAAREFLNSAGPGAGSFG
jgi:methionyl-tRNA formyltransferase